MLKTFTTLLRGAVAEAEEAVFDANAIRMLEQQLRDAAASLDASRRELACAIAHEANEERAIAALHRRAGELEESARKALAAAREDMAQEAAVIIAAIEDETVERRAALERFSAEVRRLKLVSEDGRKRLADLRRGLELARAQDALRRAGANGRRVLAAGAGALCEAEGTLARIREQSLKDQDMAAAFDEMERRASGQDLADRLSAAGFGPNVKTNPADVLARLRTAKPVTEPRT